MSEAAGNAVHVPVMLNEVIQALGAAEGGMFLDCTFGGGGHTKALLDANPNNMVVALDRDSRALERGRRWADRYGDRLELIHAPFAGASQVVPPNVFDGVLADLGMSTDQLLEGRGFSFADQGALDMRMDESEGQTAADFVNSASEREIFLALAEGGVGKNARGIARTLVFHRPFSSAKDLADAVKGSQLGKRGAASKVHPATVVFQALRMRVNNELGEIEGLMESAPSLAKPDGKLAIITFHSIEDQAVANRMRKWESAGSYPANWRGNRAEKRIGRVVNRKAIVPTDDEVSRNPASRSARLRVFQFESPL